MELIIDDIHHSEAASRFWTAPGSQNQAGGCNCGLAAYSQRLSPLPGLSWQLSHWTYPEECDIWSWWLHNPSCTPDPTAFWPRSCSEQVWDHPAGCGTRPVCLCLSRRIPCTCTRDRGKTAWPTWEKHTFDGFKTLSFKVLVLQFTL